MEKIKVADIEREVARCAADFVECGDEFQHPRDCSDCLRWIPILRLARAAKKMMDQYPEPPDPHLEVGGCVDCDMRAALSAFDFTD